MAGPNIRGAGERAVMATTLTANTRIVADVLEAAPADGAGANAAAILATRTLARVVDDILDALVHQARAEGASWARIGELFHVSRQAAFARFGTPGADQAPAVADGRPPVDERTAGRLAGDAVAVLGDVFAGRWSSIADQLDGRMAQRLTRHALEVLVDRLVTRHGPCSGFGLPSTRVVGGYVVVDVPVTLERGGLTGRVTYDTDERIAGLFLLDTHPEARS